MKQPDSIDYAAAQPSTAAVSTGPSQEGLGRGDVALLRPISKTAEKQRTMRLAKTVTGSQAGEKAKAGKRFAQFALGQLRPTTLPE